MSIKSRYIMWRLARRGISMNCTDRACHGYEVKTMTMSRAVMYARLHNWDTGHLVEVRSKQFFSTRPEPTALLHSVFLRRFQKGTAQ
jgi:hypothetical protein